MDKEIIKSKAIALSDSLHSYMVKFFREHPHLIISDDVATCSLDIEVCTNLGTGKWDCKDKDNVVSTYANSDIAKDKRTKIRFKLDFNPALSDEDVLDFGIYFSNHFRELNIKDNYVWYYLDRFMDELLFSIIGYQAEESGRERCIWVEGSAEVYGLKKIPRDALFAIYDRAVSDSERYSDIDKAEYHDVKERMIDYLTMAIEFHSVLYHAGVR